MMRRALGGSTIGIVLLLAAAGFAAAQTPATGAGTRLRVFLDCGGDCFAEYLRDEIQFVDFVRQAQDADVHVFSSSRDTGGGGREVTLRFVGLGRFAGHDEMLRAVSVTGDTENTRRDLVLRTVEVALLAFIAREGLPTDVRVSVETERGEETRAPTGDRWNAWVFSVSGGANVEAEESSRERSWNVNFGADRITEQWKITFGARLDTTLEEFDLDEDEPFEVTRRERDADWFVARSLGPHWSLGLEGRVESSTFDNTEFAFDSAPAIEFSVFPYDQYATRQLRLQYSLGVAYARYNEVTLFGKLKETLPVHEASITLDRREPWGSLDASLEFSQYLHDTSKYRIELDGEVSIRITRGLSVDVEGGVSRVRDQLALPRRDATSEEVLLRLRELQTEYEYRFDVGLTYSFGSLFNNVVNPRFGR